MQVRVSICVVILVVCAATAFGYPGRPTGYDDIPKLVVISTLVCKGDVLDAPKPMFSETPVRMTATATVRMDRCFKGEAPANVGVLFDGFIPLPGGPLFILTKGDYDLFFLKPKGDKYIVVDEVDGALPISRQMGPKPEDSDPLLQLELDLKAGLHDRNPERVLDSIRMLGNMKHLRSNAELRGLLESADLPEKTYVWEALLKLKDYSVLPAVARFISAQREAPRVIVLPRDRLFFMEGNLVGQIGRLRDPSVLPYLRQFASSPKWNLRWVALQALRAISDPRSAPVFLKALNDENSENGFIAMMSLIELAGGGPIDWAPTLPQFALLQSSYATKCREWWQEVGRKQMQERLSHVNPFYP